MDPDKLLKKREMESLTRDARTVVVTQLMARTKESDIHKFFSRTCRVKHVLLVKDQRSGRSKGIAYVELKSLEDRDKALALSGEPFVFLSGETGFPCLVTPSEAEKNFVHKLDTTGSKLMDLNKTFTRVLISNVLPTSSMATLERMCKTQGTVVSFDVPLNHQTNNHKGFALVEFETHQVALKAKETLAKERLDGLVLHVKPAKAKRPRSEEPPVQSHQPPASSPSGGGAGGAGSFGGLGGVREGERGEAVALDEDERNGISKGGVALTAVKRVDLMSKLAGGKASAMVSSMAGRAGLTATAAPQPAPAPSPTIGTCLQIRNMFDPSKETSSDWTSEIRDEVVDECSKFGRVEACLIDPQSNGDVFLKFDSAQAVSKAVTALDGRWFDHRSLSAKPLADSEFAAQSARLKGAN